MQIELLKSKIHRAVVTYCDLNYVGSITIDENLMKKSNIREYERVVIADINNGNRFDTYVIKGKAGSGTIGINGAAARLVEKEDKIIILAYARMEEKETENFKPAVVFVNEKNQIIEE